jgi:hypothetical protein
VGDSFGNRHEPIKPEDYAGLHAELAALTEQFVPLVDELWPRLEDHRYRWELYSYGLPDGYDKLVASEIMADLSEALTKMAGARDRLSHALLASDDHRPGAGNAAS